MAIYKILPISFCLMISSAGALSDNFASLKDRFIHRIVVFLRRAMTIVCRKVIIWCNIVFSFNFLGEYIIWYRGGGIPIIACRRRNFHLHFDFELLLLVAITVILACWNRVMMPRQLHVSMTSPLSESESESITTISAFGIPFQGLHLGIIQRRLILVEDFF